jgi:hypothetical protein
VRLRDWIGTAATISTAVVEHLLGETVAVAVLTVAVVVFGGILWRRVGLLMAAPRANNCTKAYAVEARLVNYMQIMDGLAPIATANSVFTTNATFLSQLAKLPHQTNANSTISTTAGTFTTAERTAFNGLVNAVNNLQSNLQGQNFEA